MSKAHNPYAIDEAKWAELDIFNQMGNIYSEVGRSFKGKTSNQQDYQAAVTRAVDLFDATILALSNSESPKLKEVLRAKEQFLDIITDKDTDAASRQGLDRYFMQFAVAARLKH